MPEPLVVRDTASLQRFAASLQLAPHSALICGDARSSLAALPAACAQTVVTSPPYWGVRDYAVEGQLGHEPLLEDYLHNVVCVLRETRRVLRDGGTVWLNIGDGYTSGGRKTRAPDRKSRHRAPGVRPATPAGLKPKDLLLLPARLTLALQQPWLRCEACEHEEHAMRFGKMPNGMGICPSCLSDSGTSMIECGWYVRSEIIWNRSNCMPESVKDRPTRAHEHVWLLTKSKTYSYFADAHRGNNDSNVRSVWAISTEPGRHGHVAPFPQALAARCITSGSRQDDLVLDPFVGSGTTAAVATALGRHFCGIELNPEYIQIAAERVAEQDRSLSAEDVASVLEPTS